MMLSEIIAWECGSCTFTNEGSEPGPCLMCCTERPRRCAIVAGATVDDGAGNCVGPLIAQAPVLLAAVASVAGATARDGAGSHVGRPAVAGPLPIAPSPLPSSLLPSSAVIAIVVVTIVSSSLSSPVARRHHSRLSRRRH